MAFFWYSKSMVNNTSCELGIEEFVYLQLEGQGWIFLNKQEDL